MILVMFLTGALQTPFRKVMGLLALSLVTCSSISLLSERTERYRSRFVPNKLSPNLRYSLVNAGRNLRNWAAQAKGCQEQGR